MPWHPAVVRLQVPLVDEKGRVIGYGDRWWTHRVRKGPNGAVLGQKHVGINIACVDGSGRILMAHRRHKIFDQVWTTSGDTHPYRTQRSPVVETLQQAARRCAMDDLGIVIKKWAKRLTVSYSAQDPRDPRYCENELMHVMVAKYNGTLHMNKRNAYEMRWVELTDVLKGSGADSKKEPIDRRYAPWVHAVFSLSPDEIKGAFVVD